MDHENGAAKPDLYRLYEEMRKEMDVARTVPAPITASTHRIQWFLAYTEPLAEAHAEEGLNRSGFEVFIPRWTFQRRLRGKRFQREVPLYRNYVFVGQPLFGERFQEIEDVPGVIEVVRCGDEPTIIPKRIIDDLRHKCDLGCFVMDLRTGWAKQVKPGTPKDALMRYRVGERVRVVSCDNVFVGFNGEVIRAPRHDHTRVLLDIFGRKTPCDLALDDIELLTSVPESVDA